MQKPIADMPLPELISECLSRARAEQPTRENALVVTKLQEAMMWHNEHQKTLLGAARRSGVGFNADARSQRMPDPLTGVHLTEPIDTNPAGGVAPEAPQTNGQ